MIRVIHKNGLFFCDEIRIDIYSNVIKFINSNQSTRYSIKFDNQSDLIAYFDSIKNSNKIDLNYIRYKHLKNDLTGHLD